MNGMTAKELEKEKLTVNRMCLDLKAKRQVSRTRRVDGGSKRAVKNDTPKSPGDEISSKGSWPSSGGDLLSSPVCQDVVLQLTDLLNIIHTLLADLINEELPEWRQRQQIACIGGPPNACVDQLQNWWDGCGIHPAAVLVLTVSASLAGSRQ